MEEENKEIKKKLSHGERFGIDRIDHKGQTLYVKKRKDGTFMITDPIVKDIDKPFGKGNIHWKNFLYGGSWIRATFTILVVVLVLFCIWAYSHDVKSCFEITEKVKNNSCYMACFADQETYKYLTKYQKYEEEDKGFMELTDEDIT